MKKGLIFSGLLVLLLALGTVTLTACAGASPLVGKWQSVDEEETYIEFGNDGRMELGSEYGSVTGTYEETGDNEIALTPTGVNGEAVDEDEQVVLEYNVSGDELTLTDGKNPVTFTRIK